MRIREASQAEEELSIFKAFQVAHPAFSITVAEIEQPEAEFPDIIAHLTDGRQIHFELAEWLQPDQMNLAKRRERLGEAMICAIGKQAKNPSQHFNSVLLFPRSSFPRFRTVDAGNFQSEMWALIEETNRRWPHERFWHSPQGCHRNDLAAYPVLAKYITKALFSAGEDWPSEVPWIMISSPCGSYSSDSAIDALERILQTKLESYGPIHPRPRLLVHYGTAVAYNTPWHDITYRRFSDVAKKAAQLVAGQSLFEKIYLLKALEPELEAYEISPAFTRCG